MVAADRKEAQPTAKPTGSQRGAYVIAGHAGGAAFVGYPLLSFSLSFSLSPLSFSLFLTPSLSSLSLSLSLSLYSSISSYLRSRPADPPAALFSCVFISVVLSGWRCTARFSVYPLRLSHFSFSLSFAYLRPLNCSIYPLLASVSWLRTTRSKVSPCNNERGVWFRASKLWRPAATSEPEDPPVEHGAQVVQNSRPPPSCANAHANRRRSLSRGSLFLSFPVASVLLASLSPGETRVSRGRCNSRCSFAAINLPPRSCFSLSLFLSLSFSLARLWPRGFLWTLEPVAPSRCHDSTARRLRSPSAWRIFYFYREVSQFPGPAIRFLWSCRERSGPLAVDFRSRAALGLPVGDGDQKIRDEKSIWWFLLANNWRALKRARGEEKRIDKAGASVWGEIACYYEKAAGGGRRPNETLFSPGISYTP